MGYELENEITVLTNKTVDILLKENPDSLVLYIFYIRTAKRQKTNQAYSTVSFVSKGLGWGVWKVRKNKNILKKFNLIEDIKKINKETGKVEKWFVKVNYIWKSANHPVNSPEGGLATRVENRTQMLKVKKENALSKDNKYIGQAHKNNIKTEHQYYAIDYVAPLLEINLKEAEKEQKGITGQLIKLFKEEGSANRAKSVVGKLTESKAFREYGDLRKIKTIFKLVNDKKSL